MNQEQFFKNLNCPSGAVDVVLDTDTYNEIDVQFALAYLLSCSEKLRIKGICAAPFFNHHSASLGDGMRKSHDEILRLLKLAEREDLNSAVYKGSETWLPDETTPVPSPAASFLADLAGRYTPEHPLYIISIGAITNVASALLLNPDMRENTVIVWLGGHALHMPNTDEFNMKQDVAAARIVFGCGVPLVQLPCSGVVDRFAVSRYELEHWLSGKNALCDYLVQHTVEEAESYAAGRPWTRVIWDVTAVAWLMNESGRFMAEELRVSPIPEYDHHYGFDSSRHFIKYVTEIHRDRLFEDLFARLSR